MNGLRDLRPPLSATSSYLPRGPVRAVLQAGGKGERIRAIAGDLAKPLIAVGDTPMLGRLLRQILDAGVDETTVVIPNGNASLKEYLKRWDDKQVTAIEERSPL